MPEHGQRCWGCTWCVAGTAWTMLGNAGLWLWDFDYNPTRAMDTWIAFKDYSWGL